MMHNMLTGSSRRRLAAVVVIAASPFCVIAGAFADDKLPSGEQVMDTFIKNSGGKAAYKRVKTRIQKASLSMPQGSVTMTIYAAMPNKTYVEIESPMGTMRRGTDGNVVWRESPMGVQLVTGAERDKALQDMMFHPDLEWRTTYSKAVCEEITDFRGEKCYRVSLTSKLGKVETRYYAVDTGLNMGGKRTVNNPMAGEIEMTVRYEDYKEVDGILYPHKITRGAGGQEGVIIIDSITHSGMPKDRFVLPEAVAKRLAEEADAKTKVDAPKKKDADK